MHKLIILEITPSPIWSIHLRKGSNTGSVPQKYYRKPEDGLFNVIRSTASCFIASGCPVNLSTIPVRTSSTTTDSPALWSSLLSSLLLPQNLSLASSRKSKGNHPFAFCATIGDHPHPCLSRWPFQRRDLSIWPSVIRSTLPRKTSLRYA